MDFFQKIKTRTGYISLKYKKEKFNTLLNYYTEWSAITSLGLDEKLRMQCFDRLRERTLKLEGEEVLNDCIAFVDAYSTDQQLRDEVGNSDAYKWKRNDIQKYLDECKKFSFLEQYAKEVHKMTQMIIQGCGQDSSPIWPLVLENINQGGATLSNKDGLAVSAYSWIADEIVKISAEFMMEDEGLSAISTLISSTKTLSQNETSKAIACILKRKEKVVWLVEEHNMQLELEKQGIRSFKFLTRQEKEIYERVEKTSTAWVKDDQLFKKLDDAQALITAGDICGAENLLHGVVRNNPVAFRAKFLLAECMIKQKKYEEVKEMLIALSKYAIYAQYASELYYQLGMAYTELNEQLVAYACCSKGIEDCENRELTSKLDTLMGRIGIQLNGSGISLSSGNLENILRCNNIPIIRVQEERANRKLTETFWEDIGVRFLAVQKCASEAFLGDLQENGMISCFATNTAQLTLNLANASESCKVLAAMNELSIFTAYTFRKIVSRYFDLSEAEKTRLDEAINGFYGDIFKQAGWDKVNSRFADYERVISSDTKVGLSLGERRVIASREPNENLWKWSKWKTIYFFNDIIYTIFSSNQTDITLANPSYTEIQRKMAELGSLPRTPLQITKTTVTNVPAMASDMINKFVREFAFE